MNDQDEPRRLPPPDNQTFGPTFVKETADTLQRHELLIYSIILIALLSLVAVVVGCIAIVLDQLHFNNQIYRDGYDPPVQTKVELVNPNPRENLFTKTAPVQ